MTSLVRTSTGGASPFCKEEDSFGAAKWQALVLLGGSLGTFLLLLWVFWVGYIGSDDTNYWMSAGRWLKQFPVLGTTHFDERWTLVLPIAAFRRIFGDAPISLFLPTLIYGMGIILVLVFWLFRRAGFVSAVAAAALIATNAQLVVGSSTATVDIAEAFFVSLALFSFDKGAETRSNIILFVSGLSLGFGVLSRETTGFVVVAFGVLFLTGFAISRWRYFVVGAGFAAVELLDVAFYSIYSGNPFYRWAIDANHAANSPVDRWLDQGAGVPIIHPLLDPVTMIFLNPYFGLCAWIGLPLAAWLLLTENPASSIRCTAVLVASTTAIWSVLAAGLWHELTLIPRYFFFPSLGLSVLAALAIGRLWASRQQTLAAVLGALLVAGNLMGLVVDNRNFMFGEHELIRFVKSTGDNVHTDRATFLRSFLLLRWNGISNHVSDAPLKPGDIYYFNPTRVSDSVRPPPDWRVLFTAHPKSPWEGIFGFLGVSHIISHAVLMRLRGHPGIIVYELPASKQALVGTGPNSYVRNP